LPLPGVTIDDWQGAIDAWVAVLTQKMAEE
jgi:hypothetical protein